MSTENPSNASSLLLFACGEAALAVGFALLILKSHAQAIVQRILGVATLAALTYLLESTIVQVCLAAERPHWAVTAGSLLWVQLLSASELTIVSRVDASQLPNPSLASAIGLLWNMRRIGTRWQVKNVPAPNQQSRAGFILRRFIVTLVAYLFVDILVSMPPPPPALVGMDKAGLFSLGSLSGEDVMFRISMTIGYWISTSVLNLFMTNVGAIVAVLLQRSKPADCPPLYGSFSGASTVRHFWGISWHQMFRSFLTGHADLIVDNTLPFARHSLLSRYTRLVIAFFISGAIHYRTDQLMGVPQAENGAIIFFFLHAVMIMLEDAVAPLVSAILPAPLGRILGWIWVLAFFVWSSPIWIYSAIRVGVDSAALLPVRLVGPWVSQYVSAGQ